MSKPLLITDCDEVLLHMVSHFRDWVSDAHDTDFDLVGGDFSGALKRRPSGEALKREEVWPLLDGFFQTEMHRQTLVPGAAEALATLGERADIVVLTNLGHQFNEVRATQLLGHGIAHRVVTNQGGKGDPVARLVAEFAPSVTVFIDDLAHHHSSVAKHAPDVFRLHMIAEPMVAVISPPAADAHARIDDWGAAVPWIEARFAGIPL
ncbi:HAD family hydrolase [Sphingomonas sp. SUN039]|uniref:HAD family hydrolase n=1 Tax=Sphingomonas sp. SUN039 TaxID=2937787 RepID=UPI002164C6CF|nr:HAD family hydrolase [Sphingomonas sp. SUN039]UVO55418.1 HAD family hydrolase [Sphingomonas sp. SUN039]